MKLKIKAGTTSRILRVFVQDTTSTSGAGLTGLAYNTAGLKCYYSRVGASSATAVTLATATAGTFTSGGFVALDGTNMPGVYELHIPNAAIASSATAVHVMLYGAANMAPVLIEIELDAVDYQAAVNFGLTCLPDAAHSNTGGLITFGTSTGQFDPSLGQVKVLGSQQTAIAGKVWDEARSGHTTSGTFGAYVLANTASDAAIAPASTALSTATWTGTRAGYLDNLSAGAVATASALSTAAGNITTILGQTGTTGVVIADGGITAAKIASDAITAAKIATGAITSAKFAAGAIDAAAIATGAIDADALATDAATEIATAVRDINNTSPAANSLGAKVNSAASAGDPWTTSLPGSYTTGQAGYILGNIATGSAPTADANAAAVWNALTASYTATGSFGALLGADSASLTTLLSRLTSTRAGLLDNLTNLDAAISTRSTYAGADSAGTTTLLSLITPTRAGYLDNLSGGAVATASALATVNGNVNDIETIVGSTGVVVASGSKSGYSLASSGLDAITVETGVNARQSLSVIAAAGGGVLSGAGTGTITIKGANVSTTRITATTDSSGNRSSITLSLPS